MAVENHLRLLENYRIGHDNALSEVDSLREALVKSQGETKDWHDSWVELIGSVGDLMHSVKERPEGKRYATVVDLLNLLRKAETRDLPPAD